MSYYYESFETYNGNSFKIWETINEVTAANRIKLELNGARITYLTEIAGLN